MFFLDSEFDVSEATRRPERAVALFRQDRTAEYDSSQNA